MNESKYAVSPAEAKTFDTAQLRAHFLTKQLMQPGKIQLIYTHYDRFVYGGIVPTTAALTLPTYDALKSAYFLERRELGIINVGGAGTVTADGVSYDVDKLECLYIGKGTKDIQFHSKEAKAPAMFYLNSAPAHATHPTTKAALSDANRVELGAPELANQRVIYQYIHEAGVQSCQLVMGFTEMLTGNVWNTFPPHLHERRMEVYFYFDLPENQIVIHLMGQPQESRHIAMQNHDAVVSPPWSIHAGAGTSAYKFVWGMAGENKAFTDMDGVPLQDFR
jgi:4-deoxy-L-threo-5-hexosulose-uronate ketol-isomerase